MTSLLYARVRQDPRFAELVAKRSRLAGTIAMIILAIFYGFVLMVGFWPELIGRRLFPESSLTVGVAVGLFQFVFFWGLTYYYVHRANGELDRLNEQIIRSALGEKNERQA